MKKMEISNRLEYGKIEGLLKEIENLAWENPADLEVYCQKATYYFLMAEYEKAISELKSALLLNPYYIDALYNLGVVYRELRNYGLAQEYFYKSAQLDREQPELVVEFQNNIKTIKSELDKVSTMEEYKELEKSVKYIAENQESRFGIGVIAPWSYEKERNYGCFLATNLNYYIAAYTRLGFPDIPSIQHTRVELRKKMEIGNRLEIDIKEPSYLPVLLEDTGNIQMRIGREKYNMHQKQKNFIGYRIDKPIQLETEDGGNILIAEPILLKKDKNKKSLILTIFVDGLSQAFLEENGFENSMPRTYRYFSDGIYCTNFYSTAEWTYPSMAAYFSGQYTVDHKMFYPDYDYRLPEDIKVLGEYLKEAGYHTAKIDGDWRTNPDYGHIRGMDRVLSATYGEAMHIKEVIYEAMDHMETMKETNQYLYLNIGELHDITDEYKLPMDVQMKMKLEDLQDERHSGSTSVKQQFNQAKKNRYREQMKYVDRYLGILFDYLKQNFSEDEILVTLFSDHGQGFLVPNGGFFLADERSKVPLLIKGASKEWTVCNEPMSIVDYLPVLGKLAGFEVDLKGRRSVLPQFFGGEPDRKYVVTESLYPGDTYKIALRNEELVFFLESKTPVQKDARVDLTEYDYSIETPNGEVIKDEDKLRECINYVMEHIKYFRIYN